MLSIRGPGRLNGALAAALTLALGACASQTSDRAGEARTALVGMRVADLHLCAGLPARTEQIDGHELHMYERAEGSAAGLGLTLPIIGGFTLPGSGGLYCRATFKVEGGRVTTLAYSGDTGGALGAYSACAPIVEHCLPQQAAR